jgi:hypothetical protein
VISSYQGDPVGVSNLQRKKQQESFDTVEASVDKVAHEQIVGLWALSTDLKQLLEVVELPMNVTTNRDRSVHPLDIAFFEEDFTSFIAQSFHLRLFNVIAVP